MKIEVRNLTKKYNKTIALNNVSFTLCEPKIYGLLGRNGAGKTTFMDVLAGHKLPTSGEVLINSEVPFDNRKVMEQLCLIKENDNFYRDLKIKHVLKAYAVLYPNWDVQLATELVEKFNLNVGKRIKALSKGMVSALGVIVGLSSKAAITIFDEPYIGLDAASRQLFYDTLLEQYEMEPRTIILSTHLIDEASKLFEDVLILRDGELVLHERADVLRERAYAISGTTEKVIKVIQNKQVIKTKQAGNLMTAYVYGKPVEQFSDEVSIEGIPIQDLMIYLTDLKGEKIDEQAI